VRFAKAAGAGEMLNIHDLKAAYEKAIGQPGTASQVTLMWKWYNGGKLPNDLRRKWYLSYYDP
jgi:hypothetical protein